jgi:hypothetical protein
MEPAEIPAASERDRSKRTTRRPVQTSPKPDSDGSTGGRTPRAFGTFRTILTLGNKRIPLDGSDVHGRGWYRTPLPLRGRSDEYGFELLRLSEPEMPADVFAIVILSVFEALVAVGGDRSSDSHPAASVRAFTIIDRAFTPNSAEHVRAWVEAGATTRLGVVEFLQ